MDRQVFLTEDGDQRLYELKSGSGHYGIESNESEYAVLSLVSGNDGIYMGEVLKIFLKSKFSNMDHWKRVFDDAHRAGYITFQSDK